MKQLKLFFIFILITGTGICCKNNTGVTVNDGAAPKASFIFSVKNQGALPDSVRFYSTSTNAASLTWDFDNGGTSALDSPLVVYDQAGNFNVKLIASNQYGVDSITKGVAIILKKPTADFSYTLTSQETLPVTLTCRDQSKSTGSNTSYQWSFGNGSTSAEKDPVTDFTSGGIYSVKLVVTNAAGSDSITRQVKISPYPQNYTNFNGVALKLYAWRGDHVMLLSERADLKRSTMFKWLNAMDVAYDFYNTSTGAVPDTQERTYIDSLSTIAEVAQTCGAGCGYLGATGIEIQTSYFDVMYHAITDHDQYDQVLFYELGRNFWLYGNQLSYQGFGPFTTGYAVFMRFMAMEAAQVEGAPFGTYSFPEFKDTVIGLVDLYLADASLNWENTLGAAQGVPGAFGSNNDLFASFCFRLRRDYGGDKFVQKLWKQAGLRPAAHSKQDVIDNFFLASCAAAGKDLTSVFQSWRWPLSAGAVEEASQYH